VEGFFFGSSGQRTARPSDACSSKAHPVSERRHKAIEWIIRYCEGKDRRLFLDDINEAAVPAQTSIFVPRHQLAEELREVIEWDFQERGDPNEDGIAMRRNAAACCSGPARQSRGSRRARA
jgi:hypothetical protein